MLPRLLTLVRFVAACLLGWLYVREGIDFYALAMELLDRAPRCRSRLFCDFFSVPGRREFQDLVWQWAWVLGIQSALIPLSQRFGFIPAYPGALILFGAPLILAWILLHMIITAPMLFQSEVIYIALLLGLLAAAGAGMVVVSDSLDDL